jgi:hypothetical protein
VANDTAQEKIERPVETMAWVDFLQGHPPGSVALVTGACRPPNEYRNVYATTPELQLFCPNDTCNAYMFFTTVSSMGKLSEDTWQFGYLTYTCRNCKKYEKTFALAIKKGKGADAEAYKFGELPHFGPPVPPRVLRLIQPDRELFLSGRRCENQGLGIGAFTYYRRVVENQWNRLVGEIIKVGKAINTSEAHITALEAARAEHQFNKAVTGLRDAIPPALLINGHNPLILLHAALSQGVHNLPDEECLELATSIRVVLIELAEKLGQALKDEKELSDAVAKLLQVQSSKKRDE